MNGPTRSRKKSKNTLKQMKVRKQQFKNLWDTRKAILRGKFIALQSYFKKQKKAQINNLTLHLMELEKEQLKKPKVSRRKEIKIRAEINEIVLKKTIQKINESKSLFLSLIHI